MSIWEYLPESGPITEEILWQAIADNLGIDVSEIADGDLAEFI